MAMLEIHLFGIRHNDLFRLRRLELDGNDFDFIRPDLIKAGSALFEIDLKYNVIRSVGCFVFQELLPHLPNLTRICVANNEITDLGLNLLVDGIIQNGSQVIHLHLEDNFISSDGTAAILRLLKEHKTLCVLSIHNNLLTSKDNERILNALAQNRSIVGFVFSLSVEMEEIDALHNLMHNNLFAFRIYYTTPHDTSQMFMMERDECGKAWMDRFYVLYKMMFIIHPIQKQNVKILPKDAIFYCLLTLGKSVGMSTNEVRRAYQFTFPPKWHYVDLLDIVFGRGAGFYVYLTLPMMGFWRPRGEIEALWGEMPEWRINH